MEGTSSEGVARDNCRSGFGINVSERETAVCESRSDGPSEGGEGFAIEGGRALGMGLFRLSDISAR